MNEGASICISLQIWAAAALASVVVYVRALCTRLSPNGLGRELSCWFAVHIAELARVRHGTHWNQFVAHLGAAAHLILCATAPPGHGTA